LFPIDSAPTAEGPPMGATPPTRVEFQKVAVDVPIVYPPLDASPAQSFVSHKPRADAIARHYASMRPLGFRLPQEDDGNPEMTENVTLQLIAHLHAISKDRGFRAPRDLPSRFLVPIRLRQRGVGTVGTNHDYDMALKGRPRWFRSDDDAEGGVEIYYQSPSFLLNAGGSFLNSGYGHDAIANFVKQYASVSRAQPIVLIPTGADLSVADLIRFEPWPDPTFLPDQDHPIHGSAVNMGVLGGLACGANLRVPQHWLDKTGAAWDGRWLFLNLNQDLPLVGPLGFYVAIYATPMAPGSELPDDNLPPLDNLAVLHALEADVMPFETFERLTREQNTLPDQFEYGTTQPFHTADGHQYTFLLQLTGDKYRPRVVDQAAPPVTDLSALKLADGPYLKAPNGHDGYLQITSPTSDAPLVLDYRVAAQPVRIDNADAWPQPLIDRARAIEAYALDLIGKARAPFDPAHPIDPLDALRTALDVFRGFTPPAQVQAEYLLAYGQAAHVLAIFLFGMFGVGPSEETLAVVREGVTAEVAAGGVPGADPLPVAAELTPLAGLLSGLTQATEAIDAQQAVVDMLARYVPPAAEQLDYELAVAEAAHNLIVRQLGGNRTDGVTDLAGYRAYLAEPTADPSQVNRDLSDLTQRLTAAGLTTEAAQVQAVLDQTTPN
jgi:hypothetical protein